MPVLARKKRFADGGDESLHVRRLSEIGELLMSYTNKMGNHAAGSRGGARCTDLSSSETRRSGLRCGCSTWQPAGGQTQSRYACVIPQTYLVGPTVRRPDLREVAVADVNFGHALQPGAPQLRGAGVGISQTVLKIHQHLRILLVLLHLCCGHQNSSDPFGQVLHLGRERRVLQKTHQRQQFFLSFNDGH